MISAYNNKDSIPYILENEQIGYKEHDGINFSMHFGYITMFAYYDEFKKHNI
jgi:hypothetical protein